MECPTCFKSIIVPQAPASESSKLIMTAAQQPSARPTPMSASGGAPAVQAKSGAPWGLVLIILVLLGGAAAFAYWHFGPGKNQEPQPTNSVEQAVQGPPKPPAASQPSNDTNWTLSLEGVVIPETPVTGFIDGRNFNCEHAALTGGTLMLRQGPPTGPPDLGLTIQLFAKQGEDLAGQVIKIETNRAVAPPIVLRWKDDSGQPQNLHYTGGYAMRLSFGKANANQIPISIYLCTPDDQKSYVMGAFQVEIRHPPPPKPKQPKKKKQG